MQRHLQGLLVPVLLRSVKLGGAQEGLNGDSEIPDTLLLLNSDHLIISHLVIIDVATVLFQGASISYCLFITLLFNSFVSLIHFLLLWILAVWDVLFGPVFCFISLFFD